MSIYEACEIIKGLMITTGCNLVIGSAVNGNTYCHLDDCWIKDNEGLCGDNGVGKDLIDAIGDYLNLVKGRVLVVHPDGEDRKEIFVM